MDFYEVLNQIHELLRSRGRVAYRALQRQFDLADEDIEALKDELIYAQQVAADEDNRVLVWAGNADRPPVPASPPVQTSDQPAIDANQPSQAEPLPKPTADAERRQLTVMFCDLADSTRLSGQLDPEDLRDVIRAYQSASAEVIERYDGYIAQHLGDGLMVYFGWPQAHEDDAQRAVHAGLGILEAMQGLNAHLEQEKGIRLAVRIGIHTGLVVVGEIGQGASQEHLALGETPNIASRVEGVAAHDTVAISEATYQLVQDFFVCDDLGRHALKGVGQTAQVYRVVRASTQRRLDGGAAKGLTPLVGREQEIGLLIERWQQVKDGHGQVVLLSGEAGIGKSRLVQVLKDRVAAESHKRLECRSSPYYQNTALYPLTDLLQRSLQWQQDDPPEKRLEKLEQNLSQYRLPLEESVPLFASLLALSIPEDRYPPLNFSPQRRRQKTLEVIVAMLLEQAEQQPVLFILEDTHWTDPSTLELVDLLIDQTPTAQMLTLITYRPEFQPTWGNRSYLSQITLNRLSQGQIEQVAAHVAGDKSLPPDVLQQLVEKTDGVPLYVEEMTKAVLDSGVLKEMDGQYELTAPVTSLSIPATLQDSLMARLDRLMTAKVIAQLGAVIGRQFSYELLQTVSQLDEVMLQHELGKLVEAEIVYQRGLPPQSTYTFKHALIQDTAYESLLRSTRQQYHAQIANVLESQFPDATETQPELLAHHYTEAGLNEQAVSCWHKAGQGAVERSANVEAVSHLNKGLVLLSSLPETPERVQQELDLQVALGTSLMVTKGYSTPEVEHVYTRAHTLCQLIEDNAQLFTVLIGLRRCYAIRGELQTAHELAEQLLILAQKIHNREYLLEAHYGVGFILYHQGLFVPAHEHWKQGVALYDAQQHRSLAFTYGIDPGVHCLAFTAETLEHLGYLDQSVARKHDALTLAQELSHPFSLTRALLGAATVHQLRREWHSTQEYAEAAIVLATEQGFTLYAAVGTITRGWALAMQGREEEGIAQMHQGLAAYQAIGAVLTQPRILALLAEVYGNVRQSEEGLVHLSEALAIVDKTRERWYEAELHRLRGELLLQLSSDNTAEAESWFDKALSIARQQQAKSFELRAATSLARLWQSQGKRQEAYELLEPVYSWFTEGFDTADLREAKGLLEELG